MAWRNVWRSRTRSLVVIGAVILAIWSLIFIISLLRGIVFGYIEDSIKYQTAHIQVHQPEYLEDNLIQFTVPDGDAVLATCDEQSLVAAASPRVVINTMIATSHGARGVQIRGVEPEREMDVVAIASRITEGEFLNDEGRNHIVLGASLAEKLKVGVRKKVVLTFQQIDGEIGTGAFRIKGLFNTNNKQVDDMVAYVRADDIRNVAGMSPGQFHELGLSVQNIDSVESVVATLRKAYPDLSVRDYEEVAPELALFNSQVEINMMIMTSIIMLALIFGIINTMLMAVLERTREIGMLMAIGMGKARLFTMVVIETCYVSIIGAPIGMLLGYFTIKALETNGLNLSMWSEGLAEFGMSTIIYPTLDARSYMFIAAAIVITALIAAIFPSRRAIKLKPVEAMRKI